ncbi:hypothetical protein C0995_006831 [Termitomyces sp. Mi166|nr:hypothetical protein C0995_006831 [Termitomyces sp. Mi166\
MTSTSSLEIPREDMRGGLAIACESPYGQRTDGRTHATVEAGERGAWEVDLARTRARELARAWDLDLGGWSALAILSVPLLPPSIHVDLAEILALIPRQSCRRGHLLRLH